jgi:hypothetical protein
MANIFKTTLKKDVIVDIVDNNIREIRFPITKFWATRFADEYNLDEKTFKFKSFNSLELSSPSNKDTISETYEFAFVRTFVDGDEFVMEFKDGVSETVESYVSDSVEMVEFESVATETTSETTLVGEPEFGVTPDTEYDIDGSDVNFDEDIVYITNEDVFAAIKEWFDEEKIVDNLYELDSVFATDARQVIILTKGKVLGSTKRLPVNNDVEIRVEFDMTKRVYFEPTLELDFFAGDIYKTLEEICKNNFVFIWKRYTGIFMDTDGRIYFGIKYSTRKANGFNRKYNVQ